MATATLKARLTLNDTGFQAGLNRAVTRAKAAGAKIKAGLSAGLKIGASAGVIGALVGGAAFAKGLKGAFDLGGALSDLSSRTGAAANDLLILGQALADNGVEAGQAGSIINKMQKTLGAAARGSKVAAQSIDGIGLAVADLRKLSPVQQIDAIGQAINRIPDPARRASAAMEIFGRSGGELLTMFADENAIGGAAKTLGRQAELLATNAATFDTISDRMARAGIKLQGFFVGSAAVLAPAMLKFTEALDKVDLANAGERFAESILKASDAFVGAFKDPGALLGPLDSMLTATLADGAMAFRDSILKDFDKIGVALSNAFSGPLAVLKDGMITAAAAFSAMVQSGMDSAISKLAGSKVARKVFGLTDEDANASTPTTRVLFNANRKAMTKAVDGIVDTVKTATQKASVQFRTTDFGKAAALGKAKEQTKAIIATGARATGEWMGPMLPPKPKVDPFSKFTTMGFGAGGLSTGGLGGQSGLGGAYNQIRRGDSAKRAAEARKIKDPVEESNALLTDILNVTKTAWGN
jgi:hypothetical protein